MRVCQSGGVVEQQLDGGIANAGQVVRVGPHVLRPSSPHTVSIHAFLRAVRDAGFEGASSPVGVDEDGRERLVFIEGDVPVPPYPDWSQSDTALASIARLLRGLHDATRGFDARGLTWSNALADPAGGTLVCHNDIEPSNVVFRDGIAVALLDFEFAAPGRAGLRRGSARPPLRADRRRLRSGPARLATRGSAGSVATRGRRVRTRPRRSGGAAHRDGRRDRSHRSGRPTQGRLGRRELHRDVEPDRGGARYERRRRWWADNHDRFAAALR